MASTPGTFQFKIKSYDNEEGEFSAWQQAEPGVIIQFVLNHWFNATLPNNLDIIVIKNMNGDQLVIDHENKDVFRFFLIPAEKGIFYYYKMTDIRFMFFTLEHFFSGLLDILKENLNKTTDDWRWVKGDFIEKNFHYTISRWRIVKHFAGLVLFLIFVLAFTVSIIFIGIESVWLFSLFLLIGFVFQIFWAVGSIQWYLDQRDLAVQLSRGDRFIHIWKNGQKKSIPKSDIVSVQQHFFRDSDGDYWIPQFTELKFQNGDFLNIHELLLPQHLIKEKFTLQRELFQEVHSDRKRPQQKTNLSGYFPESSRKRYAK